MIAEKLEANLRAGLDTLGADGNVAGWSNLQIARLLAFVNLLSKWNRVYNLTAVRDPAEMIKRHLLDSLSILPYLKGVSVIDVGAGAGLPGIPLAIALPDVRFVLLDSNNKKTRFMQQAKIELQLHNVTVVCCRVEQYRDNTEFSKQNITFDTVISRAFSSLTTLTRLAGHLCDANGRFLAMKGIYPEKELAEISKPFEINAVHEIQVPSLNESRYLIEISFGQISPETAK
ncbi:MAG: 16S rRNA (guanine(527)-N(7))-methyltransferase RsmG [Gammaproteobacteria bacterium]|nr:16S rRNA (guanine(527)-N(7))-methyltransferase RsmG [Gammaproteobacteria bacterium]